MMRERLETNDVCPHCNTRTITSVGRKIPNSENWGYEYFCILCSRRGPTDMDAAEALRKWFEYHVPKNVETFATKMED